MFTGSAKIVKPAGQSPDDFEQQVAQELFNLEVRARGGRRLSCAPVVAVLTGAWRVRRR